MVVLQHRFLDNKVKIPQCTFSWLKMPFCVAEQAISRGGYKQQTAIIIDSVTQAFYMHEEDSLVHLKIGCLR